MNKWELDTWLVKTFTFTRVEDNTQVILRADNLEHAKRKLILLVGQVEIDAEGFEDPY